MPTFQGLSSPTATQQGQHQDGQGCKAGGRDRQGQGVTVVRKKSTILFWDRKGSRVVSPFRLGPIFIGYPLRPITHEHFPAPHCRLSAQLFSPDLGAKPRPITWYESMREHRFWAPDCFFVAGFWINLQSYSSDKIVQTRTVEAIHPSLSKENGYAAGWRSNIIQRTFKMTATSGSLAQFWRMSCEDLGMDTFVSTG